jgi:hypothetical protein
MADNQLGEMSHDVSFICESFGDDGYSCDVEGYTEDGEVVSETVEGVTTFKTDGDNNGVTHSMRHGTSKIQFTSFSDCFYDPAYGGSTVYCGDRHP